MIRQEDIKREHVEAVIRQIFKDAASFEPTLQIVNTFLIKKEIWIGKLSDDQWIVNDDLRKEPHDIQPTFGQALKVAFERYEQR